MRSVKTSVDEGTVDLCPSEVKNKKLAQKIFSRATVMPSGCWEWTRGKDCNGYGTTYWNRKNVQAHRMAYVAIHGPIASSKEFVCHHCDNPSCVNPRHLFLGTHRQNIQDAARKGRMVRGEKHPFTVLTEEKVRDIRRRLLAGETHRKIAANLGVTAGAISGISDGRSWAWLV